MDLTGRQLGKYTLLEKVGQGGMASVYRAHQPTIDRDVAVKVLHSHLAEDEAFRERFRREAKGLGRLRHPHIVNVIDFDRDGDWYYMVMDYVEGETLEAVLNRRGALRAPEALRLTAQLAGALDYAHEQGRIHRDVKPGNILFADEAQRHAVVTDFGLARLLDNATITISGTLAGTPAYMSPEAAQGQKADARSDVFSLGIVLYEMVTGQRPYQGDTPLSIIMKVVLAPLPPARSINPKVPPEIDDVLSRAMAHDPQERFQTAGDMRREMLRVLALLERGESLDGDDGAGGREIAPPPAGGTEVLKPALLPASAVVPQRDGAAAPSGEGGRAPGGRRLASLLVAVLALAVIVATGLVLQNVVQGESPGSGDAGAGVDGTSSAAPSPETPVGVLRFAAADQNGLRQYTLSLDGVEDAPAGFHYELWFDLEGEAKPVGVARLAVDGGRITYADVLVESLAERVLAARISLEPEAAQSGTQVGAVRYEGRVEPRRGLAEIGLLPVRE